MIDTVLFDYGGVIAAEGFYDGLMVLAQKHNVDGEFFVATAFDRIYTSGYLTGQGDEAAFWRLMRETAGIRGCDDELRREILKRFIVRPWVLDLVDDLRSMGIIVGILSDQTDWLDELDRRDGLFERFDHVFNSYYLGLSKRGEEIFDEIPRRLGVPAHRICFIDDNEGNCDRARKRGILSIFYRNGSEVLRELAILCPGLDPARYAADKR